MLTNENSLILEDGYKLAGFSNPLGVYPAAVVPIIFKNNSYYAVYTKNGKYSNFCKVSEQQLKSHEGITYFNLCKNKLNYISCNNFSFNQHALFAFSNNDILSYPINSKKEFYKTILIERKIIQDSPFLALPLALKTKDEFLICEAAYHCGCQLEASHDQLKFWYTDLRKSFAFLPDNFYDLSGIIKKKNHPYKQKLNKATKFSPLSYQTKIWFVVDATNLVLGRISSQIANILRGKHKPCFSPHLDLGDRVIVINAKNIKLTGRKKSQKMYYRHSGYIGGLKEYTAEEMLKRNPERVIEESVKGMLPKNKLSRHILKGLKIYSGSEHPHHAQCPIPLGAHFRKVFGIDGFDLTYQMYTQHNY